MSGFLVNKAIKNVCCGENDHDFLSAMNRNEKASSLARACCGSCVTLCWLDCDPVLELPFAFVVFEHFNVRACERETESSLCFTRLIGLLFS